MTIGVEELLFAAVRVQSMLVERGWLLAAEPLTSS